MSTDFVFCKVLRHVKWNETAQLSLDRRNSPKHSNNNFLLLSHGDQLAISYNLNYTFLQAVVGRFMMLSIYKPQIFHSLTRRPL